MKRFFVEQIDSKEGSFTVRGPEARHIARVLRMGPGDRFILMDRTGARYEVTVASCDRHEVRVFLERPLPSPPVSPVDITLCQALLKSGPMDYIIQKTSELGVNRILPFVSERTVIRPDPEGFRTKARHWQEIARNAATQSDRAVPADIGPLHFFDHMIAHLKGENALKIILWESENCRDLKGVLAETPRLGSIVGVVGPEGGLTPAEVELAREGGFHPASLGHRILRAETAAQTLVAILQYERGDLSLADP